MNLKAAQLVRLEWERALMGYPDRDRAFQINVVAGRLWMKHDLQLSNEEIEEALSLTQHNP